MEQIEVTIKYKLGHSYKYLYEKTEFFCPSCGKQSVWVENFYDGPIYVCISCEKQFYMPVIPYSDPETTPQIVEQIGNKDDKIK